MATSLARLNTAPIPAERFPRGRPDGLQWPNDPRTRGICYAATLDMIEPLRSSHPEYTVALTVMPMEDSPTRKLVEAARLGVPVYMGREYGESFRQQVTDPGRMVHSIVPYLRLHLKRRLSVNGEHLIHEIFRLAPAHLRVEALLEEAQLPKTTSRARLHKKSLPSVLAWFNVARVLHAALRLQADERVTSTEVSRAMKFSTHSPLYHGFRRVLRLSVDEARGVWGWEWMMDRWLRSNIAGSISLTLKHED